MENYQLGKSHWRTAAQGLEKEWLMVNGIGGYANCSVTGELTRCHSGYLIASLNPPVERTMILSKTQERFDIAGKRTIDLACQRYLGKEKNGCRYLEHFSLEAVPEYSYQVEDIFLKKTIALVRGENTVAVCYEVENGMEPAVLHITPLFNVREAASMTDKSAISYEKSLTENVLCLEPKQYPDLKVKFYSSAGTFIDRSTYPTSMAAPTFVVEEDLCYTIDVRTGSHSLDSHYTPYDIDVELKPFEKKKFYMICSVEEADITKINGFQVVEDYKKAISECMDKAVVQDSFARKLAWASDSFLASRNSTGLKTILAGFPWFTDWGRDTMIAFHGLTLCTGRIQDARDVLESFSLYVKNGLIPNVFPNKAGEEPMYNTMDASMWYFYAVDRYLVQDTSEEGKVFVKEKIFPYLKEIVEAYKNGTDFSIHMDDDGLVAGGSDLDQITWMDVRVGEWVVTPRHGKPVEINALWYNALKVMEHLCEMFNEDGSAYRSLSEQVKESFCKKFWNEETGCLFDVVDENDGKIRPNQLWAVSLPYTMLSKEQEKSIVTVCKKYLYTSYGMRSLSWADPDYHPIYIGECIDRDAAYHMGTVWAYPIGAYLTAYCKAYDYSKEAVLEVKKMCELFLDHMEDGCLNGIAEIFDGDFPCTSRGCFSQAWSVGEVLRVYTEDVMGHL